MTSEALVRLLAFLLAFGTLAIGERLWPRRTPRFGRRRWRPNLLLTLLNTASMRLLIPLGAFGAATLAATQNSGLFNVLSWPPALELGAAILLMDLSIYWQHRIYHWVPWLWRFHAVHHADNDFDVTTGLRFHTVSMLLSVLYKMAVVFAVGASPLAVIVGETALNLMAMFNHSNIDLPASSDKLLRLVAVTPDMHRVHHSVEHDEMNCNFGFNFPWWDRLFGTYRAQPRKPHTEMTIGLPETQATSKQSLWWMLRRPFLR